MVTNIKEVLSARNSLQEIRTQKLFHVPYKFKYELAILCEKLDAITATYQRNYLELCRKHKMVVSQDGKLQFTGDVTLTEQDISEIYNNFFSELNIIHHKEIELSDYQKVGFDELYNAFTVDEIIALKKFIDFEICLNSVDNGTTTHESQNNTPKNPQTMPKEGQADDNKAYR